MFKTKSPRGLNNLCGKNLKRIRLRQNPPLSQRRLAQILQIMGCEVDYHFIRRAENGERYVTDIELVALSRALHVSLNALVEPIE